MSAYLLIIRTEDKLNAQRFVARVSHMDRVSTVGVYRWTDSDPETCLGSCKGRKSMGGWTRHPERGHTMHECGGRNPHWRKWFGRSLFNYLGRNLLKSPPKLFRNPKGY